MSFKQYCSIDILILFILYGICEYGIIKIGSAMIDQPYIISLMLPILLIVLMRWDVYAIYQAIGSAIFFVLIQHGDMKQIFVYLLGNLGVWMIAVPMKKFGKERITSSVFNCMVYVLVGAILMEVFRYVGMLIMYQSGIGALIRLLALDALSIVFSIVVILIVRNIDGLFMDQKTYLLNLQKEKEEENSSNEYM